MIFPELILKVLIKITERQFKVKWADNINQIHKKGEDFDTSPASQIGEPYESDYKFFKNNR